MASDKMTITKLKGSANYKTWAIRMKSLLIREGLKETITMVTPDGDEPSQKALSYILLTCEDGPLLQVQSEPSAKHAWDKLQVLYNPSGFSSEFILFNEFFNLKPENPQELEPYLNEAKRIVGEL